MHHLVTMDQHQLDIVQNHPLGAHLEPSCTSLHALVRDPDELDTVNCEGKCELPLPIDCSNKYLDLQTNVLVLLSAFLNHSAARLLSSQAGHSTLHQDLLKLTSAVASNTINYN